LDQQFKPAELHKGSADTKWLAFKVCWQQQLLIFKEAQKAHQRDQCLSMCKPQSYLRVGTAVSTVVCKEAENGVHQWKTTLPVDIKP